MSTACPPCLWEHLAHSKRYLMVIGLILVFPQLFYFFCQRKNWKRLKVEGKPSLSSFLLCFSWPFSSLDISCIQISWLFVSDKHIKHLMLCGLWKRCKFQFAEVHALKCQGMSEFDAGITKQGNFHLQQWWSHSFTLLTLVLNRNIWI